MRFRLVPSHCHCAAAATARRHGTRLILPFADLRLSAGIVFCALVRALLQAPGPRGVRRRELVRLVPPTATAHCRRQTYEADHAPPPPRRRQPRARRSSNMHLTVSLTDGAARTSSTSNPPSNQCSHIGVLLRRVCFAPVIWNGGGVVSFLRPGRIVLG